MAIVSMKKLVLVGYGKDKSKVLKCLHKSGCVEVSKTADLDNTYKQEEVGLKEIVSAKLLRLNFVFSFLKAEKRKADLLIKAEKYSYEFSKKPMFNPAPRFEFDEFNKIFDREEDIFDKVAQLEQINARYMDIKTESTKLETLVEQIAVFSPIVCKLSAFADTKNTAIVLGAVPINKVSGLEKIKNDFEYLYIEASDGQKFAPVVVICLKEQRDEILARLNEVDFIKTSFTYDMTANQKADEANARLIELETERLGLLTKALDMQQYLPEFKQLYDYYVIENAKANALDNCAFTKSTFVLEGWCPAEKESLVVGELNKVSDALVIDTRDPVEGDNPPTLTKNNKVVAPYETITNMFSFPSMRDIDPNPFVAFFYFMLFGIMMGDAIYGIILTVGGFLLYHFTKPVPGKGKLMLVIAMGGISTTIWGVVFGGYMALPIEGTFLEKLCWFNPLDPDGAIMMLLLSLAIGVIQIMFGMGLKAYSLIKSGHWFDALCNIGSWYFALIGLGLFAGSGFLKVPALKTVGLVLALIGVGIMLVFGGRNKKGFGKVTGGLGQLYGGVNFLSDVLSYSRLFGLGLATGVIAMVINKICMVIVGMLTFGGFSLIGYVVAAPIFLIGHIFNIGINTLGTYVHDSRLQFIEFFSRFYEGGGHEFIPLGSQTKYTYIEK